MKREKIRRFSALMFRVSVWSCAVLTMAAVVFIVLYTVVNGISHLTPDLFALHYTSENVSLLPALVNTVSMTALSLLIAVPVGVGAAVYLVEYASRKNRLVKTVRLASETLSGVPSIVYGLFGNLFFVRYLGLGLSILSGALTLSVMILPLVMRTTEEALLSVPDSYREGSFGLGAGKLRTLFCVILPTAVPGILSGVILGIGRILGESAALIFTAGSVAQIATDFLDAGRTLSVHMYVLSGEGFHIERAYATALVLLVVVFLMNGLSGLIAKRIGKGNGL